MKNKLLIHIIIQSTLHILVIMCMLIPPVISAEPIIIDHTCADITQIPQSAIEQAKANLHIAYGHTSHGSQLTTGMIGLVDFANGGGLGLSLPTDIFAWNNGGTGGALDLHDRAMGGDVGYYPQWENNTRAYLDNPANADVNVIIWSWCGQVDSKYSAGTLESEYLIPMAQLEADYPNVKFVYMTGHVNIWGDANNKAANQMIRNYCIINNKILYDFEDIEHYDPDGIYFEYVNDNCNYYDSAGGALLGNWATEWQNSHIEDKDWYTCSSAHSQPLNANRKAYAAWHLWARIAGWNLDGTDLCPGDPDKTDPGLCGCGVSDVDTDSDGTPGCNDGCPDDPNKIAPGQCGCGVTDTDTDGDGTPDCNDEDDDNPNIVDYPSIDYTNDTIDITFNGSNMQGADIKENYEFSPTILFDETREIVQTDKTYRLYMNYIPEYTIITMTVSNVTDNNGNALISDLITLNDDDTDGMADDWESYYGISSAFLDADSDGLNNRLEFTTGTIPIDYDSDNDDMDDGWEVANGLRPLFDDSNLDIDNDGITNLEEYTDGSSMSNRGPNQNPPPNFYRPL